MNTKTTTILIISALTIGGFVAWYVYTNERNSKRGKEPVLLSGRIMNHAYDSNGNDITTQVQADLTHSIKWWDAQGTQIGFGS